MSRDWNARRSLVESVNPCLENQVTALRSGNNQQYSAILLSILCSRCRTSLLILKTSKLFLCSFSEDLLMILYLAIVHNYLEYLQWRSGLISMLSYSA